MPEETQQSAKKPIRTADINGLVSIYPHNLNFALTIFPRILVNEIAPILQVYDLGTAEDLVLFDVGGNHGIWSAAFISIFGSRTKTVEIFEPMPSSIKRINANLSKGIFGAHWEKITINEYGISNTASEQKIYFDREGSGLASMANEVSYLPARNIKLDNSVSVSVRDLDTVCKEKKIDEIDVLKVDIEGFELFAYQGATEIFDKRTVKVTIFEFGPHQLANRHQFKDFYDFFIARNYSVYQMRAGGGAMFPIPVYSAKFEMFDTVRMFLAVRN